ncbi:hypothetical protein TIFTF001_009169 [Ficus carica]|uniref:Uncharacterized protein n=1 Tax=Ficus carica TaxID=3494 RepID=A0AA88A9Z8_FICCA|nr:hypothetical protein TIFTF001_009169 [Ficus carica]
MRGVNLLVNLWGVAMIIYSLWLLKKWRLGLADLSSALSYFPKPWCGNCGLLEHTLRSHCCQLSQCFHSLHSSKYIFSICLLLLFEVAVVETTFFRINWGVQLSKYIDEHHIEFKNFVLFHIMMCRLIVIVALIPQIYVIVLAIILWGIGTEPRSSHTHHHSPDIGMPDFRHSFLVGVGPNSSIPGTGTGISGQNHGNFLLTNSPPQIPLLYPRQNFLLYVVGVFRTRFPVRFVRIPFWGSV